MDKLITAIRAGELRPLCNSKVSLEKKVIDDKILLSRVINVTGAGYADCSGLYAISNMTSIWDSKRIVFERVAGGWRPMDKR